MSVVTVPIRGAGRANILDADALARLEAALLSAERRGARAAMIHGPAGRFAAGADLSELEQLDGPGAHEFARAGARLFRRLEETPLWLVAAVDGHCIGGGFDVALACDVIVATPGARFLHPGTRIGFPTAYGGNRRLPARIGSLRARDLLLRGRTVTGSEAYEMGLVAEIVAPERLWEHAQVRAAAWSAGDSLAMRRVLQETFRRTPGLPEGSARSLERAAARLFLASIQAPATRSC